MKKETQNLTWTCLPKEAREEIKKDYKSHPSAYHPYFNEGYGEALKIYFGKHNLTSDTEPSEFICVERVKVDALQSEIFKEIMDAHDAEDWQSVAHYILDVLPRSFHAIFGDKCLPDKEPSAQVEPKKFFESDYGIGNKVVVCISSIGEPRKEVVTLIRQYQPQCENNDYAKTWVIQTQDGQTFQSNEEHFEPYTEPETKDMEEKELNLVELLKGCDETAFYSPTFGVVLLKAITENDNKPLFWDFGVMTSYTYADGRIYSDSVPTIFPSRALYEKYPLDPVKAWSIWASERKPKRWRAEEGKEYWYLSAFVIPEITSDDLLNGDDKLYECGNYFRTKDEAQQASEAVREYLEKFHEQNQKQYEKDSKKD